MHKPTDTHKKKSQKHANTHRQAHTHAHTRADCLTREGACAEREDESMYKIREWYADMGTYIYSYTNVYTYIYVYNVHIYIYIYMHTILHVCM